MSFSYGRNIESILFPSRARRRRQLRIVKFVVLVSTLVGGTLVFLRHEFSALQSWQISQRLNQALGLSLEVQSESIGVGVLRLGGVSVEGSANAEIASIIAQTSLNPFAKDFGRPSSVRLSDFSIELNPDLIARLISRGQPKQKREPASVNSLPSRVEFDRGNIIFIYAKTQPPLELRNVSGHLLVRDQILSLRAGSLNREDEVIEHDIQIEARRNIDGRVRIEISRRGSFDQHQSKMSLIVSSDMQRAKLSFDFSGASNALQRYIAKYVVQTDALKLAGRANLQLVAGKPQKLRIDLEVRARNLQILYPLIDRQPVALPPLYFAGQAMLDPITKTLDIPRLEAAAEVERTKSSSPQFVKLSAMVTGLFGHSTNVQIQLPQTACSDLLSVIPRSVSGEFGDFKLMGSLMAKLAFGFGGGTPFHIHPSSDTFAHNNCEVVSTPERLSKSRLRYSQALAALSDGRKILAPESSPRSISFVDLEALPEYISRAFVAAEDRKFYIHKGFDFEAIQNAVRRNIEDSDTTLGGSTISQQLAKNIFLSREKNLARKIRETMLTWYLERYLNKPRILELYLNMVEFGPQVYGITQASNHYFGKDPRELSKREAVFLAYLLPSPIKRSETFRSASGKARVERIIDRRLRHLEVAESKSQNPRL